MTVIMRRPSMARKLAQQSGLPTFQSKPVQGVKINNGDRIPPASHKSSSGQELQRMKRSNFKSHRS